MFWSIWSTRCIWCWWLTWLTPWQTWCTLNFRFNSYTLCLVHLVNLTSMSHWFIGILLWYIFNVINGPNENGSLLKFCCCCQTQKRLNISWVLHDTLFIASSNKDVKTSFNLYTSQPTSAVSILAGQFSPLMWQPFVGPLVHWLNVKCQMSYVKCQKWNVKCKISMSNVKYQCQI